MACAAALFVGAPWIGAWLYHQPALAALLRIMAPMTVCFALHQVICGMLAGMGMQRRALTGTILSSCVTLILTAVVGGDSASAAVWRGAGDDDGAVHQSVLGADAAPAPRAGKRKRSCIVRRCWVGENFPKRKYPEAHSMPRDHCSLRLSAVPFVGTGILSVKAPSSVNSCTFRSMPPA